MKVWIVVLVLLLLAALVLRERFTTYEEALRDVGQSAGYINPRCDEGYTISSDMLSCEMTKEDGTKEVKTPTCPIDSNFVKRGTRGLCEPTASASSATTPGATTPGATTPGATTPAPSASSSSTPAAAPSSSITTSSSVSVATGGSSGNLIGPTSGGVQQKIWGPVFTGRDTSRQETGGDSTKSNVYPELLGGQLGKSSARIDGVGIVSPSQPGFGLDMGTLPSSASLGTDALSRFLPFSRQPGDMDVVPDPYRLAKNFSTKNYSSEKDPVPFLTDFSAFYK
jgi:hypothetical protein